MTSNNHFPDKKVGAIVIGGDYQGLGIVRSLGRSGIPVGVLDDETSIARYSRYALFAESVRSFGNAESTLEILMDMGRKRGLCGWVIYPTRDETVAALSQHKEELSKIFRIPTPAWDTVQWLWDKRKTCDLAQRLGIPVPRTRWIQDIKELDHFDGEFPVALKPAIKEHFIYETGKKAWRADNLAHLKKLFGRAMQFMPISEIMIQDLIPGDGTCQFAYCSLFKKGEPLASLVVCRRRQHPFEFGRASTYVESVDIPVIEDYSKKFLRSIDYYGLVELEYKRDPRDGQYYLLDVNGRTWGYHTIGCSAGVDFSRLLFKDQMNECIKPSRGKPGVRWMRLLTDFPTAVTGVLQGKLDSLTYLRSFRDVDEEAVFSLEDPLPGLMEVALLPYLSIRRGF
jgi:D-aspartate ligase